MLFHIIFLLVLNLAIATPPACFLKCINSIAHICEKNQADLKCLCKIHEAVNQCNNIFCPEEHFYSARDHFSGTCVEHGYEFEIPAYEPEHDETPGTGSESDAETGSGDEGLDGEPEESEHTEEPNGEVSDADEWSEGSDWSENTDWVEENDVDLSELNQDVIKNYMNYFLKQKPASHAQPDSPHGVVHPDRKPHVVDKPVERPLIVHGPIGYVPHKKVNGDKNAGHKIRHSKYDGGFDREKQDQILRRRF